MSILRPDESANSNVPQLFIACVCVWRDSQADAHGYLYLHIISLGKFLS